MIDKTVCSLCGSDLAPVGSRFCPSCGCRLAGAGEGSEGAVSASNVPMAQAEPIVDVSTVTYDEATQLHIDSDTANQQQEDLHSDSKSQTPSQPAPTATADSATYYLHPTPEMLQRSQHRTVGGVLFIETSVPRGKFTLAQNIHAGTILGGISIDTSHANFVHAITTIHVGTILGSVKLTVPRGVKVETYGLGILGGFASPIQANDATQVAPLIILRGASILGDVRVQVNQSCPPIKIVP